MLSKPRGKYKSPYSRTSLWPGWPSSGLGWSPYPAWSDAWALAPAAWEWQTICPTPSTSTPADEMGARLVLELAPGEIAEREGRISRPKYGLSMVVVIVLIITAAALLFGVAEMLITGLVR